MFLQLILVHSLRDEIHNFLSVNFCIWELLFYELSNFVLVKEVTFVFIKAIEYFIEILLRETGFVRAEKSKAAFHKLFGLFPI